MMLHRVRTHFTQAALVTTSKPAYAAGVRAAIATMGPIVVGANLGWHEAVWMGLAGFNAVLADKGGALRTRVMSMGSAAVYGAIAAAAGGLAAQRAWSAILTIAVFALAAGLARTYGAIGTTTGVVALATFIVSVAAPSRTLVDALGRGEGILLGSAFAMLLALAIWPVRPYRPARFAVARIYRALADGEDVHQLIDAGRMSLAALRRGLNAETPRGERLLMLVENASSLSGAPPDVLRAIAIAVVNERTLNLPNPSQFEGPLHNSLVAARELNEGRSAASVDFRREYFDPIVQSLNWDSVVLRHALRVAIAAAAAQALTQALHISRGYWMTLSVIIILQPYTSSTFQKGLQRAIGTIGGAFLASLLLLLVHSPAELTGIICIGAALTVALLPVNYGLYSLCLTPTFVLLAELDAVDRHLVWLRMNNTLMGTAIAYIAALALWPASERGRVRDDLVAALRALADYTRCIGECDDEHAAVARRDAILGLENCDASLQRLLGDRSSGGETESLMSILIYARHYGVALTDIRKSTSDRLRLEPLMRYASDALHDFASAIEQSRAPADLGDATAARRVERANTLLDPLVTLCDGVKRLAENLIDARDPVREG